MIELITIEDISTILIFNGQRLQHSHMVRRLIGIVLTDLYNILDSISAIDLYISFFHSICCSSFCSWSLMLIGSPLVVFYITEKRFPKGRIYMTHYIIRNSSLNIIEAYQCHHSWQNIINYKKNPLLNLNWFVSVLASFYDLFFTHFLRIPITKGHLIWLVFWYLSL